jgi:superfamily II DNA or RNA helicase
MQLRPRQEIFCEKAIAALDEHGNTLGVAPTGAGKTVMLSAITGHYVRQGASAMVLQHRDELVQQNRATFERVNPRSTTGLFTADRKEWGYGATFAMVATLAGDKNLAGMPPLDVLAIDEGHHAVATSYMRIIDTARKRNPKLKLLLVTATPNRGDKKALRAVVDNVSDQITLKELIEARLLVRPRTFVVDIGVQSELSGVRKTMADFDMEAVAAIMDRQVITDRVISEWSNPDNPYFAADRQTVVFCSTVDHAKHVTEAFCAAGYRAICVEGTMGKRERREAIAAYDRGEFQVIVNVAVLTEGWDNQPTSCVILLRPSSYKSTMIQMIGRGLRKVEPERYPGVIKDDAIILDFGTSILLHGSIEQDTDLEGKGTKDCPSCEAIIPEQCRNCAICNYEWPRPDFIVPVPAGTRGGGDQTKAEISDFVMTEVDLLADSPFRYETLFDGIVSIASALDAWAVVVFYNGRWNAIGGGREAGVHHLADNGDRLLSMAAADDFLREHGDKDMANKAKRWMAEPPSDKQISMLGIDQMQAMGMTKYHATCLIQWRFSEKAIRRMLERSGRKLAA